MINTDLGNLFSGTAEGLWQLGKEKDSVAWSKIVKMHSIGMLNTAKGILGDHYLAEDAVQNAFLQIRDLSAEYFRREKDENSKGIFSQHKENTIFKNDFAARNWIIRITYFVAKDMKKSRVATKDREKVFTQNWVEERESRMAPDQELLAVLQTEIEKLPEELRLPLVLRFHCDLNFNQVSSELGLAVHVIRKRVEKGIEVLQAKLATIVGSSMPAISVESLLRNMFTLNEGLSDSLVKSCADLLDKPALTKLQLTPENKLLLQSSKFMAKGLVMLKVLAILSILVFTAMFVMNSIQSNETKEQRSARKIIAKESEYSPKKAMDSQIPELEKDNENFETIVKDSGKVNSEKAVEIKAIDNNETIVSAKKENPKSFDINEILPYFSDKASFTLILPDISQSTERFKNSSVSKFYNDLSVDLLGKIPFILQSRLNINTGSLSGGVAKILIERIFQSFHCIVIQYSEVDKTNANTFFVAGILKKEEEKMFSLLLEALKPFYQKTSKTDNKTEIDTYQFSKNLPMFALVKIDNKIFFGTATGKWENKLDKKPAGNPFSKASFTSDAFWNLRVAFLWKHVKAYLSELLEYDIEKDSRYFEAILGIKYLNDISGEISIQPETTTHKIEANLKEGTQRGVWDILQLKKITPAMVELIPADKVENICLNLDLKKTWESYNAFMQKLFKGEEELRKDYEAEVASFNVKVTAIFQMDLDSLINKSLTGEVVCWISQNQDLSLPSQVMRFKIQEYEYAKKLVKGLESFFGEKNGITFNIDKNYISISYPANKVYLNKNYQNAFLPTKSTGIPSMNYFDKNFYCWANNNFSIVPGWLFVRDILDHDLTFETGGKESHFRELIAANFKLNTTSILATRNQLTLEMNGFNDIFNLFLLGAMLDEDISSYSESPVYKEIRSNFMVTNTEGLQKDIDYISSKGYLSNGKKTGLWTYFNEKGEVEGEGNFINGKEEGFWKKTEFGDKSEGEMVNGLQTGLWTVYEIYVNKTSKGNMSLGKKNGLWKTYYENKSLESEGEFVDDKAVGIWKYYHDNGIKKFECVINQNGRIEGEVTKWDKEGNICAYEKYKKGRLEGNCKHFENQKLIDEAEYKDGVTLWSKMYYPAQGNLKYEYYFDSAKGIESTKMYHSNGRLKKTKQSIKPMKDGKSAGLFAPTGEWLGWYENGAKQLEAYFDEKGSGLKTEYFENGKKCVEIYFKNGIKDGKAEGWYENGNPFFSGSYEKGRINNHWTIWYLNGNKKAEGEWKEGKVFFGWKIWRKTGELEKDLGGGVWENLSQLTDMVNEIYLLTTGNLDDLNMVDLMKNIRVANGDSLEKKLDSQK